MNQLHTVYKLCNPDDGAVFYIGVTDQKIKNRYLSHINCCYKYNTPKDIYIRSLLDKNQTPTIHIVETMYCPIKGGVHTERETFWIHFYLSGGAVLLNVRKNPLVSKTEPTPSLESMLNRYKNRKRINYLNVYYLNRMNIYCLHCDRSVPQTLGKRAKQFCNNTCRVKYWKKQKEVSSGLKKRGRGRPKKEESKSKDLKGVFSELPAIVPSAEAIRKADGKLSNYLKNTQYFMGHEIPEGLKGIDLAIWKAEIKEKTSK